jgi:hypothetical protein
MVLQLKWTSVGVIYLYNNNIVTTIAINSKNNNNVNNRNSAVPSPLQQIAA